jgi:hypothetical protein
MSMFTTIRREWKTWFGIGFFLVALTIFAYQLYCAWAYGTVYSTRFIRGWISYDTNPIWFITVVAFSAFSLMPVTVILMLMISSLRAEYRFFQKRASRLPLDEAIRDPFDRRA